MQDWATYLEYLQSILIEFDPNCALEEDTIIWYFWKGFRSSVQVKMEQRGQKLNSFKEIVEKAVNAKAKAALRPCSYTCNTNKDCFWDNWPSAAKTSTQGQPMKDPWVKKPKPRS